MTSKAEAVRTLRRRQLHLEERIAAGERDGRRSLDWDRAELAAIRLAIKEMERPVVADGTRGMERGR